MLLCIVTCLDNGGPNQKVFQCLSLCLRSQELLIKLKLQTSVLCVSLNRSRDGGKLIENH